MGIAPVDSVPADKRIWLDSSTPKAFVFSNPPTFQIYDPAVIAPNTGDAAYAVDPNTLDVAKLRTLTGATSRDMTKRKQPWLQSLEPTLRDGAVRRLRERAMSKQTTFDASTAPAGEIDAGDVQSLCRDRKGHKP